MCHFNPSCRARKHRQYYHVYDSCSEARADLPCQSITLGRLPRVPAPNRCPECVVPVVNYVYPHIVEDKPRTLSELLRVHLNADAQLGESWKSEKVSFAGEGMFGDWRPVTLLRVWKNAAEDPFFGAEIPEVSLGLDWDFKRGSFDARNEDSEEISLACAGFIRKEVVNLLDLPDEEAMIMAGAHEKEMQDAALHHARVERAESDLQYFLHDEALQSTRQHCQDTTGHLPLDIID